ncbi:hypothetical protein GY45DRAFT_856391 [Cubamyces sp. BRFM 1775]|nr:hypothetical protein GY45DRAFT_856391 [Cubamyces sp. BRFM 1775]
MDREGQAFTTVLARPEAPCTLAIRGETGAQCGEAILATGAFSREGNVHGHRPRARGWYTARRKGRRVPHEPGGLTSRLRAVHFCTPASSAPRTPFPERPLVHGRPRISLGCRWRPPCVRISKLQRSLKLFRIPSASCKAARRPRPCRRLFLHRAPLTACQEAGIRKNLCDL